MPKRIEDVINELGFYITEPKGTSMFPLLKPGFGDVCIVKIDGEIKKHDVVLYIRKSGSYVLHRVLDIQGDEYICCGDNQWTLERGVTRDMIIGRLESWYAKGKKHTVTDKRYLRYVKFWCKSLKRRKRILGFFHLRWRIQDFCYKVYRKLFKKGN